MNNKLFVLVLFVVAIVVSWDILDFLYTTMITGNQFQFESSSNLINPIIIGLVGGYLFFIRGRK